jgi:ComF family protein
VAAGSSFRGVFIGSQYIEPVPFTRLLKTLAPTMNGRLSSLCAVCRGWGAQRVCAECVARFASVLPRCAHCALEVPAGVLVCGACLKNPPPWQRALAAVDYVHPWADLLARFKFNAALDLAPALVQRLVDAHQRDPIAADPGLLLPMPLSPVRLRERGHNQAWELARRLATRLNCTADAQLLLRLRDTPHQTALALSAREANVRGAFAVEPRRLAELRGRELTLVDDVMTTGASAAEATRVLLQAGAARVQVWVVARTPRPGSV